MFTLTPENDSVDEVDEPLPISGMSDLPVRGTTVLIADDDELLSSITLAAQPGLVSEGAGPTITGIDSAGGSPGDEVRATVPAGGSLALTAQELESGESDDITSGALGTGHGKWRLQVVSDQPIHVLSLLKSPTGYLTNLSTTDRNGGTP